MKKFNLLLIVVSLCLLVFGVYNIFFNPFHAQIEDDLFFIIVSLLILFIFFMMSRRTNNSYLITLNKLQFPNFEKLVSNLKSKYEYEIDYDTISDNYVNIYLDQIRITCSLVDATIPKDTLRDAKFFSISEYDKKAVLNHDSYLVLSLFMNKKHDLSKKELQKFMSRMTSEILDLTDSIGVYHSQKFVLKNEEHKVFLKDFFISKVNNDEFNQLK